MTKDNLKDETANSTNTVLSAVYGIQHSVRDIDGEIKGQNIGDEEGDTVTILPIGDYAPNHLNRQYKQ